MTTWERAQAMCLCGNCANWIARGDPMFVITLPAIAAGKSIRARKIRCTACAGEAPPDLPALVERAAAVSLSKPTRLRELAAGFDWKAARAGEREPGSDDV